MIPLFWWFLGDFKYFLSTDTDKQKLSKMIELVQDLKRTAKGLKRRKLYSKLKKEVWRTLKQLPVLNFVCDTLH